MQPKITEKETLKIYYQTMKRYNLINNISGWFCFAVAAVVYLMTIEPTASFWDCGEFITSAYKLEVGHPPGAPFFMLTGKFFSLFANGPEDVARMVNSMSALLSAATILFLFWTITYLAKKLIYTDKTKEMTLSEMIAIIGCGLVGALTYTFTDTFWFSAVEGEVYAYSSMFTALVFWLILKWENRADQPRSDKWLVLIAYAMGLSIGVHLLNLLCIPAIVLVYYFKKTKEVTWKGTLIALAASFGLIVVMMYGIIPGFIKVGGWFELLFVNDLGFSYNSGVLVYGVLLIGSIVWGLYETLSAKGNLNRAKVAFALCMFFSGVTFIGSSVMLWLVLLAGLLIVLFMYKKINFRFINTTILCLMVVLIGYSSFALIPIRSIANTPMDQNSPEHIFSLGSYLNREQYGDMPLFYGRTYISKEDRDANGRLKEPVSEKKVYDKVVKKSPNEKDRYVVTGTMRTYGYTDTMFFPRMYSDQRQHIIGYRIWGGIDPNTPPTFMQNMEYFFNYQVNFMYLRYFMWNFSGRQNDIQGNGGISNGNWITGIGFVDELLGRGPQDNLPPDIANNKGHNVYYAIPFILGILGIFYQLTRGKRGEQQFLVTLMLFVMTGLAIIIYLNQKPYEPRERDYAYAGSFYAYCIWIGFAVAAIWNILRKKLGDLPSAIIATVALIFVPIQMASQNWDDHDRSERYTMRDFGRNYLDSCEPDAILFTNGDNDTFPLWYVQEVEGYRTDVRVCNLSYLQTDWYVDQMRRQAYNSAPLPISWTEDRYQGEKGQAAYIFSRSEMKKIAESQTMRENGGSWLGRVDYDAYFDTSAYQDSMPLADALEILKTKDNFTPHNPYGISKGVIVPAATFTMPIDTTKVNWVSLGSKPQSNFTIDLSQNSSGAIYRQEIMIMEMLKNINDDGWKRPIYFAVTVGDFPLNLYNQLSLEGISYRIVPGQLPASKVNTEVMFDNMVNKFKWGGANNPKVYLDENNQRMCRTFRMMFTKLATSLIEEGKKEKALIVLDKCVEELPGNTVPRSSESLAIVDMYYDLGQKAKAEKIMDEILARSEGALQWYARLDRKDIIASSLDIRENLDTEIRALDVYQRYDRDKYEALLEKSMNRTEMFLSNQVSFDDRSHPLDLYWSITLRGYMTEKDTVKKKQDYSAWERTAGMMQKYNKELLQKYQREN